VVGCPFGDLAATQGGIGRLSLSRERLGCPYDGIGCLPSVPSGEGRLGCRVPEVPHAECPRPLIWTMDYRILGTLGGWSGGVAEGLAPKERRLPPPRVPTGPELDYRLQKSGRPVRVEWLEWWKGWLLRSGAFPLPGCPRPSFPAFSCQALARREWGGLSLKEASTPLLPSPPPPSLPPSPSSPPTQVLRLPVEGLPWQGCVAVDKDGGTPAMLRQGSCCPTFWNGSARSRG
jgi:hypothetical protein